ncbi:MAG: hypothetical protein PVG98_10190, partial [Chromatiales bacterium]
AELPGGDFAVIAVDEVREGGGEAADAPRQNALVAGVARARGDRRYEEYVDYLRGRTDITINTP